MALRDDEFERPRGLTRADLMTARETGEMLGVAESTVLHWGRIGILPRVKLGRHVRFVRHHVEQAILRAETEVREDLGS